MQTHIPHIVSKLIAFAGLCLHIHLATSTENRLQQSYPSLGNSCQRLCRGAFAIGLDEQPAI